MLYQASFGSRAEHVTAPLAPRPVYQLPFIQHRRTNPVAHLAIPHPTQPPTTYRAAPRRRRRRRWLERQERPSRGRFELALIGGGSIALVLAVLLPGKDETWSFALLIASGCAMTLLASITGFVPAIVAAVFAPIVVALTDPMWTLGSLADFNLGSESSAIFALFAASSVLGAAYRKWIRRERGRKSSRLWRASARTNG